MAADMVVAGQCACRWCGGGAAMRAPAERGDQAPHMVRRPRRSGLARVGELSPHRASGRTCPSGSDPIYIPSAPDFLINIFVGIWAAIALVSLVRVLPSLRGVFAVRDRCRPFPPNIESRLPLWLEAKASGRRATLMICDEVPGATVLGFHGPCIAIPSTLVEALTVDELDQVHSSRACARAATRRLGAAGPDAVAVCAVDPSGRAVRITRVEPRARNGVRRMGRRADRFAEGVREMSRARCRSARADERRPDAGTRAHRQPPRASTARRSRARHQWPGAAERVPCRCDHGGVRDGDDVSAAASHAWVLRNCRDCFSDRSGATGAIGAMDPRGARGARGAECNAVQEVQVRGAAPVQAAPQTLEHAAQRPRSHLTHHRTHRT